MFRFPGLGPISATANSIQYRAKVLRHSRKCDALYMRVLRQSWYHRYRAAKGVILLSFAVLGCTSSNTRPSSGLFPEARNSSMALATFIVTNDRDCASAALAADMLRWPSVRTKISVEALIVWGSNKEGLKNASVAAKALGTSARRPSVEEVRLLDSIAADGRTMLIVVDRQSRLRLVTTLTHDLAEKRAFVAWVQVIQESRLP